MFEIVVSEKQSFMGMEIPVITGGFGEGQKILTIPMIKSIHKIEVKTANQDIKRLIEKGRMKEGVDFIDIKGNCELPLSELGWNGRNIKNAFILSQRGYSKLIKYMDDEKSWEVHDRLIDEYFQMKEIIQTGSTVATISDETIKRITEPFCLMIQQQSETLNTVAKTVEMVVNNQKKQEEEIKKLEAKIVQESSMKKFEDLAEKQFKEQCKTDTRTMRNQFMAEVDVKCIHLDRALKPAELAKYYKKDSKEFNSWLQSIGLQYKEAGCWVIAQKYKDQGYSDTFTGPYGTYLGWTLKGCVLIYDLLAARGKYPQIQEAFEQ